MNLYLDEDASEGVLAKLLRQAGHDVMLFNQRGVTGEPDPVQLRHAVQEKRVFLSRNHKDFEDLHELLMAAQGHHFGILIVRRDNDPTRDMTPRGTLRALEKLVRSGITVADGLHVLNQWR